MTKRREIKQEWCEAWIKHLFTKPTIDGKPIGGIYTELFWNLAEKSGLWVRGTYGSAMTKALRKLCNYEIITDSNGNFSYYIFILKKAV